MIQRAERTLRTNSLTVLMEFARQLLRRVGSDPVELLVKVQNLGCLKLIIAASGILEERLKELVKKLGLDESVRFVPHVHDEARLNKIYNLGDLLVLPQVPGTVSIPAVACGLPVVTVRNSMGLLAAVDERVANNFILCNSPDPREIANTCYQLLKDPQRLDDIRKAGLELITEYSWERISARVIEFLENLRGAKLTRRKQINDDSGCHSSGGGCEGLGQKAGS